MTTPEAPVTVDDDEDLTDPPAPSPTPDPPAPELAQEPPTPPQTAQIPEPSTTFTMPELPGITFAVVRGGLDIDGKLNPSWIQITGTDNEGAMVSRIGFAGP